MIAGVSLPEEPPEVPPEPLLHSRRLLRLALPIIGLNVLNVLALAVDTAMVGRMPEPEVGLVGLSFATQILFLLMVAMMGLTVGTVAFVARAYGARQPERVVHILAQSSQFTVFLGVVVAVVGNLVAEPLLGVLGASGASMEAGLTYLRPMLIGVIFNYLNLLYAAVLRGVGNTRLAFQVALAANLINAFLNYGLILGNLGFPALGVLGSALGTVTSQIFSVSVMVYSLRRGLVAGVTLPLTLRRPDLTLGRDLLRIGAPAAMDMLVLNIGFISVLGFLGRISQTAVAAHGIGFRIQALAFVPGMSISQAIGAMVGNALGAGDLEQARAVLRSGIKLCVGVMSAIAVVLLVAAVPLVQIFDVDPTSELGQLSLLWMRMLGCSMPFVGVYIALGGLFQGSGATRTSLRINFFATLFFQIPISWFLGFPMGMGPLGIWAGFPLAFIVKLGLAFAAWKKGDWARVGARV